MTEFPARSTPPKIIWQVSLLAYLDPMHLPVVPTLMKVP